MKSPIIGRFCGAGKINHTILSTGPRLLVHYLTTSRPQFHKGFNAYYEGKFQVINDFSVSAKIYSFNIKLMLRNDA